MEHSLRILKWHETYLDIARNIAYMSHAQIKKVGCILVKDQRIISTGYNGTPNGFDNCCEEDSIKTKPEVLHAESNAIAKCAKSTESSLNSILYTTLSPCFDCAKLIIQAGISEVYYRETYRNISGIQLLIKANIKITKI